MILGYGFLNSTTSARPSPALCELTKTVQLENTTVDECYAESSALPYSTTIPEAWNYNTNFDAKFNGNLLAGNLAFAAKEVTSLRLKRRKRGDSAWDLLYTQTVNGDLNKLNFTYYDKTCRANTRYEYTIVPVIGQVEGNFYASEITTDFCGLIIMDDTYIYQTELDVTINTKRSKPRNTISTINRKYPYQISNGAANYDTGTTSAQWVPYDSSTDTWNMDAARDYVSSFKDFLNNGAAKLMKYYDGRMWIIDVSSSDISDTEEVSVGQVHTSFDWVEIGDADNMKDLYKNGLSDVEV